MNKEAFNSIYAYNMLFNNSSGNNADGADAVNAKLNTHLISDFDLRNFNPKRFEYYTTLLKMFDNDQDTLEKLLIKYNSVKSLKVKERKLIREINDYVNKINKTTVGREGGNKKPFDIHVKFEVNSTLKEELKLLKEKYDSSIQSTASGSKTTSASDTQTQKTQGTPSTLTLSTVSLTPGKFTNAIDEFIKAIDVFNQNDKKDNESIDVFEQSIDEFNKITRSYGDLQSGGITIKEGKAFIHNIKLKKLNNNIITPPLDANILNSARTIIEGARKLARDAKKKSKQETSEDSNAAGSFKAQVFATKGLKELLEKPIKEKATASSNATQKFAKEAKIISAKASVLEAYAEEYVAYANLQVEKKGEYEKDQATIAPLQHVDDTNHDDTIENIRKKKIAVSKIKVYDAFKKRLGLEETFKQLQAGQAGQAVEAEQAVEKIQTEVNIPSDLTAIRDDTKPIEITLANQVDDEVNKTYKFIIIKEAENEVRKANKAAVNATEKAKIVRYLVKKVEEEEKKAKNAANKANLIGQELAKKAETEAKTFIEEARKLITEVEKQKIYAYNAVVALDKVKSESAKTEQSADENGSNSRLRTLSSVTEIGKVLKAGGASPEEKYSDDTLKAQYLEKQRYRSIPSNIKEEFRNVRDDNKGKVVRIKTDNKIDQLSNDIDTYNALSIEDMEDNTENIIKKIKDFENDPQNPLDELEITLDDRIVFIIATFFIRYITLLMVQWCIDINIITSFYEGFIYYAIIYIILFWFVVLFINIDNSYDVKYMNFNGIINSIRSLFYYFYMGTNGISRLLIHTSLIILLIVIPIILNIKKKPEFKDEANHDDTAPTVKILSYDERKQLSKTLTLFTMFIWLFTSIIATKF